MIQIMNMKVISAYFILINLLSFYNVMQCLKLDFDHKLDDKNVVAYENHMKDESSSTWDKQFKINVQDSLKLKFLNIYKRSSILDHTGRNFQNSVRGESKINGLIVKKRLPPLISSSFLSILKNKKLGDSSSLNLPENKDKESKSGRQAALNILSNANNKGILIKNFINMTELNPSNKNDVKPKLEGTNGTTLSNIKQMILQLQQWKQHPTCMTVCRKCRYSLSARWGTKCRGQCQRKEDGIELSACAVIYHRTRDGAFLK